MEIIFWLLLASAEIPCADENSSCPQAVDPNLLTPAIRTKWRRPRLNTPEDPSSIEYADTHLQGGQRRQCCKYGGGRDIGVACATRDASTYCADGVCKNGICAPRCGVRYEGWCFQHGAPNLPESGYFAQKACETKCEETGTCAKWNWAEWKCYLMGENDIFARMMRQDTCVSGFKCECDKIHDGPCNAIIRLRYNTYMQNCLQQCQKSKECQRWTWVVHTGCAIEDDVTTWQQRVASKGTCGFGTKCPQAKSQVSTQLIVSSTMPTTTSSAITSTIPTTARATTSALPTTAPRATTLAFPTMTSRATASALPTTTPRTTTLAFPTMTSRAITSTIPPTTSRATTSKIPSTTSRPTTSTIPSTTSSAMTMRKNVTAHTVLILKGALPSHSEVCQNWHPLIQRINSSIVNLMNGAVDLDIVVVGVHSGGEIHPCTDIDGIRFRRSPRGLENQILLIEYVISVSSTAEQNFEEVFSGDDVDLTHDFADVSEEYTVVSAITTSTDLEDIEQYFLGDKPETPAPHERNGWVYVICVVLSLMIVCSAYLTCTWCLGPPTLGLNTGLDVNGHQIHDASVLTRNMVRDAPDMHQNRDDASRAGRARA